MTREEAIQILRHIVQVADTSDCSIKEIDEIDEDAIDMAIKALEQEPRYCDRNICLRNEYNGIGCNECEVTKSQEPILDKIKTEIKQERVGYPPSADYYKAIMKCLQIIDKYMTESEE